MATLANNLLATAALLASVKSPLGSAALRRSVSTAYYALFSRLAALCAGRVARSQAASQSYRSVYRALDHGPARNALLDDAEFRSPLGDSFKRLQEARHWADYSSDTHPATKKAADAIRFTTAEAQEFVAVAREAVGYVDARSPDAKQRLAVLLIARPRR